MLATGQLGHHPAVTGVGCDLGGDNRREGAGSALNHGGSGLVAGRLDAEDEAAAGMCLVYRARMLDVTSITLKHGYVSDHAPIRSGFTDCGQAADCRV